MLQLVVMVIIIIIMLMIKEYCIYVQVEKIEHYLNIWMLMQFIADIYALLLQAVVKNKKVF
jgi:hypothetical protein